jgi:hypothetical protein
VAEVVDTLSYIHGTGVVAPKIIYLTDAGRTPTRGGCSRNRSDWPNHLPHRRNPRAPSSSRTFVTGHRYRVLNMGFPYMDGLDLCRQLREISEVLIIILEDRDKRKDIIPGLEIGADDYMTKSFDQMELITHARSVLRRASVQATSSLQSFSQGRLVINFSVREVRLDGTSST